MSELKRIEDTSKVLPVIELYTAVQAEGSRAGYPTVVVRTTGCTHRCYFGEGGWCDSWYSSIHPEKGKYTLADIGKIYDENPHITEMMLTGGSPTLHMDLVNELTYFCADRDIFMTIETEGSFPIETDYPVGLVSISPKFSNSVPKLGAVTPQGKVVDQAMIDQHNKHRKNIPAIATSILNNYSFHIKPVIDKDLKIFPEVEQFLHDLAKEICTQTLDPAITMTEEECFRVLKEFTWLMPAGDNREALLESYGPVLNLARDSGYKFTGRPHIIAFGTDRLV